MNTFRWVFVEVYAIVSFNFVNMRFLVKIRRIYFHGKFIAEFCYLFFFSHIFPCMNEFLFTENNFLSRLIK